MSAVVDVRDVVLAQLAEGLRANGLTAAEVSDDTDLLGAGLVDSFGLLELIGRVEEHFGLALDFEDVDFATLTELGAFCAYVDSHRHSGTDGDEPEHPVAAEVVPAVARQGPLATLPAERSSRGPRRLLGRGALGTYRSGVRVRDKLFSLLVAGGFGSFGSSSVIQLPVRLKNEHRIAIGSGVFVGAGAWLQVLDGESDDVAIVIGDESSFSGGCVLSAASSIRLGRDVGLARNVYIADHTHAYDDPTRSVDDQGITQIQPVEIGDGAWLGENAFVMPGVSIGKHAVVSANSVVTRDVPDYTVVAGQPARVVRRFGPS